MKWGNIFKLSKIDFFSLLGIFFLCILSVGRIINYYFFYDDFFLFYALQFPTDKDSILAATDASGYHFLQPFFTPLFQLFGYEAKGYYIISFILFLLFILVFYFFVKSLLSRNQSLALFSSLIVASGYIGVEALTWNMGAGPNNTVFLILCLLSFIFITSYLKKNKSTYFNQFKLVYLLGFIVSALTAIYFFQFRSFLLFVWIPLLILTINSIKKLPKSFLFLLFFIFILGFFFYKESLGFNSSRGAHVNFDIGQFMEVYTRNMGNIFFPAELLNYIATNQKFNLTVIEVFAGIVGLSFILATIITCFIKKIKERSLLFFFGSTIIINLFILQLAISLVIVSPAVWYSSHRFYIVIFPFLAGFLGTILVILQRRSRFLTLFFLGFWIISHAILSNQVIKDRWENPISHLQYFYQTLREYVPEMNNNDVLLITQGEPTPVSILVSARDANALAMPAGFYGKRTDNFKLVLSPAEAVETLNKLKVSEDHLYALHYRRRELLNVTEQTREILKNGRQINLGWDLYNRVISFNNLSLPTSAPLYLNMQFKVYPDFPSNNYLNKSNQILSKDLEKYFKLLFKENVLSKNISVTTKEESLSFEHEVSNIIDGDYSTTWIPKNWHQGGLSILLDLERERNINRIVWSSSRTASWYARLPSDYKIELSKDGFDFHEVKTVKSAPIIKTGEFFIDEIPEQVARFVKITINKTRGGLTPAIDEVEFFDSNDKDINFNEYFLVKQNPQDYFFSKEIARHYLKEILKNFINLEISWRVDENTDYPVGRSKIIPVEINRIQNIHTILPIYIGKEVKSLKIQVLNFPAKINIRKASLFYPKLGDLDK
ncbi:discoidin domain-containing protein [Candidatus Microgenomates bacterium]|nr:discoidin domain-containing protein [Candidatus Microgenomates bacterium]